MGKKAVVLVLLVALVMFCGNAWGAKLSDSDCIKCHKQQPTTIAAHGGKHKTKVGCLDCHTKHPPEGKKTIPECSVCHSGKPHYDLKGCGSCHTDTHAPLNLKLEGAVTGPCLTCHEKEGAELKKHPSSHTDLACNECHAKHRLIPDCMECHERHTKDMEMKTCLACHPVHMPLVVNYSQDTPSHYCAACHDKATALLKKNPTKHKDLTCVYCHRAKHKTVPSCISCKIPHGEPHPPKMLKKFPVCGDCHGIAHDLRK